MDKNLAEEGKTHRCLFSPNSCYLKTNSQLVHAECADPLFILGSGVLEEAEFYNIASLVRLVKERIRDNENRTSQVHETISRRTEDFHPV